MAILTYVDSGVLIYAAKATSPMAALALPFLTDPNREYLTSNYVRLEVLPKAIFHKNLAEANFYRSFFKMCIRRVPTSEVLLRHAMDEACNTGISGLDAIHIACALIGGADEFITSEKKPKPIHRVSRVKVVSIFP